VDPGGLRGAVGEDEAAELAARALDRVVDLAGSTRKPSVTSLKWWISDSIEVESSERGGSTYLRSSAMKGPPGSASSAWPMIFVDSTISASRTR